MFDIQCSKLLDIWKINLFEVSIFYYESGEMGLLRKNNFWKLLHIIWHFCARCHSYCFTVSLALKFNSLHAKKCLHFFNNFANYASIFFQLKILMTHLIAVMIFKNGTFRNHKLIFNQHKHFQHKKVCKHFMDIVS